MTRSHLPWIFLTLILCQQLIKCNKSGKIASASVLLVISSPVTVLFVDIAMNRHHSWELDLFVSCQWRERTLLALICLECWFSHAEIKAFCDNRDKEALNQPPLQPPRLLLAAVTKPFPCLNSRGRHAHRCHQRDAAAARGAPGHSRLLPC